MPIDRHIERDHRVVVSGQVAQHRGTGNQPGKALFLVGPSSSGKTSLGHQLMAMLPDPWHFYEADFARSFHSPGDRFDLATPDMELRSTYGTALALKGYLDAGFNLIVERSLWWPQVRSLCAGVFAECAAYLVGLRWDLELLEEREQRRTDGIFTGTARQQALGWGAAAWDLPYDLLVDAATSTTADCARAIAEWLRDEPPPAAIRALASGSQPPEAQPSP